MLHHHADTRALAAITEIVRRRKTRPHNCQICAAPLNIAETLNTAPNGGDARGARVMARPRSVTAGGIRPALAVRFPAGKACGGVGGWDQLPGWEAERPGQAWR